MKIKNTPISTDDFYYALFEGGYLKPQEILEDQKDIDEVTKAIATIKKFKNSLEDSENFEYH